MLAEERLREGNLDQALAELENAVRSDPANSRYRVFLFQLLCVRGEWTRALNQLNVLGDLDPATLAMVQMYRAALSCEAVRSEVFAGRRSPLIFGEPEAWIALMLEALKCAADGRHPQANQLREQALDDAPAVAGTLATVSDEQFPFAWLADADARFGPLLEAVVQGKYFWIPLHRVAEIHLEAPADLRDLVWMPAHFRWTNGGEEVGLIPTRYPGSETSREPQIRLARRTDWTAVGEGAQLGTGQRMLATDQDDYPLLTLRQITLTAAD
jgi:type VI secretion system protein ImpE